jgi:long-subunit acyl-CoA synthetase (AMP-forming)
MTESSPVTHFQPGEGAILGGCGVPIPNTLAKIIDIDTGSILGPNQVILERAVHKKWIVGRKADYGFTVH